jgi:hypothetical protein
MPIILVPQADAYGKTEQFIMDNGGTVTLPNGDTLTFSDISVFKSPSYLNQFPNGQLPANTILPNGQTYKEVLDFYQANPNGTPTVSKPNLAPATNKGVETNAPAPAKQNDGQRVGAPTTPSLGMGGVVGTTVDDLNNNLAHACDFVLDLKKNIGLKNFIKAIAKAVREGIRGIQRLLGFTDYSGSFSTIINRLKSIAEEIRYIQKEYIQPIIDFEKYVLAVLVKIRAMIQWILSLPAKLLALLGDCLKKLIFALKSIFTDALKEASTEVPLGGDGDTGFSDAIKEAKAVLSAGSDLLKTTSAAVAGAAVIATSATVGLISPVSASDVAAANKTITAYESSIPKSSESSAATPEQNKSAP